MKLTFPDFSKIFDTEIQGKINSLIIESRPLLVRFLSDINNQLCGIEGKAVVSSADKVLPFTKNVELIDQFIPFEIGRKSLLTKVVSAMEKTAVDGDHYSETLEFLSQTEKYLDSISFDFDCDIGYSKLDISSIFKAVGVEIKSSCESIGEKLIDYFELVREFDRDKLFITVNLRSYIDDSETESFIDTIVSHGYNVVMIESFEHKLLRNEERYIVDEDLCEIF